MKPLAQFIRSMNEAPRQKEESTEFSVQSSEFREFSDYTGMIPIVQTNFI